MTYPRYIFTYEYTNNTNSPLAIYQKKKTNPDLESPEYIYKYHSIEKFLEDFIYRPKVTDLEIDIDSLESMHLLIKKEFPEFLI